MANYDIKIKVNAGGVYSTDSNGCPLKNMEQATKFAEELAEEIYAQLNGGATVEIENVKNIDTPDCENNDGITEALKELDLTKEQVLQTLVNYKKIMDRVAEVVDEIGFTTNEFDTFESDKTEFDKDIVYVTAYDSHYDSYDATGGSFPLDFLFESEEHHKNWYKNKREKAEQERLQEEEQRQRERELAELQRLKEKYE